MKYSLEREFASIGQGMGIYPHVLCLRRNQRNLSEAVEEFWLDPGVRAEPHFHDTHEFFYILEGSANCSGKSGRWSSNRSRCSVMNWNASLIPMPVAVIQQIPGIGPIVATAIVAAIGNGAAFRKGREFAAWLGLVPRQYSTGGKARLMGISKPATHTCARSWCMVPELRSTASRETERQLAHGWTRWSAERTKMCSSVHLLTSWHELHGLCCPVVNRTVRAPLR